MLMARRFSTQNNETIPVSSSIREQRAALDKRTPVSTPTQHELCMSGAFCRCEGKNSKRERLKLGVGDDKISRNVVSALLLNSIIGSERLLNFISRHLSHQKASGAEGEEKAFAATESFFTGAAFVPKIKLIPLQSSYERKERRRPSMKLIPFSVDSNPNPALDNQEIEANSNTFEFCNSGRGADMRVGAKFDELNSLFLAEKLENFFLVSCVDISACG